MHFPRQTNVPLFILNAKPIRFENDQPQLKYNRACLRFRMFAAISKSGVPLRHPVRRLVGTTPFSGGTISRHVHRSFTTTTSTTTTSDEKSPLVVSIELISDTM
jgi:hypothetical protein